MPQVQPRLRKREIAFALAAGGLATGAAALILDEDVGPDRHREPMEQVSETAWPVTGFDQVSVSGPQDVDIIYAADFKVTASGSADALAQLEAVVENGNLVIRPREGLSFGDIDDVTITVAMPALTRVAVDGSGDVTVERATGPRFAGVVGGSGTLAIGLLEAEEATLSVTGSGAMEASGTAGTVSIEVTGSGEIRAAGLTGNRASVAIQGSGEVDLTVQDQAAVAITGSGEVDISGPGVCSVTGSGSGEVRCEGGGSAALD